MSFFDRFRRKKEEEKIGLDTNLPIISMGIGSSSVIDRTRISVAREKEDNITYIKSLPLMSLDQVPSIGEEIRSGNIIILDTEPMNSSKNQLIDLKRAIDQIRGITRESGGDLAQLGESHYIVITPASVKIWERRNAEESPPLSEESNEMIPSNISSE